MATNTSRSTLLDASMKHISLLCLTFQNSALILVMHYSRVMPMVGGQRYLTSTAVFLNEVIKLTLSLTVALYEQSNKIPHSAPATTLISSLSQAVFSGDSWKLAIPAVLYTLQNSLQYVAVSNLDAATFQITYQIKILTTAIFSVLILRRKISLRRWLALLLLAIGVAIVQIPANEDPLTLANLKNGARASFWFRRGANAGSQNAEDHNSVSRHIHRRSATYQGIIEDTQMDVPPMNPAIGLPAVIISCVLSGLAGVYFEKVLKDSSPQHSFRNAGTPEVGLWIRNVQLSFYSVFPALFVGVIFKDGDKIARNGFFSGYNWIVWVAILLQAAGGIIVALVVNYADNIAKNFATSISILISLLASVIFLNLPVTLSYFGGTAMVLFATYLYSAKEPFSSPPIVIADYEKTTVGGQQAYYDEKPAVQTAIAKSEARTTSRPGTPTLERHHKRVVTGGRSLKRDE